MAVNDRVILDVVQISIGAEGATTGLTPIHGFCSKAELVVTNTVVTTNPTFGQNVTVRDVSESYDWSVMLNIFTDGYGGTTIDQIITNLMRAPLGPATSGVSTKPGVASLQMSATGAAISATNPSYRGNVVINEWRPLGTGDKTTAVTNSVSWMGAGPLTPTPART